jgi:hypothetical protein
MTIDKSQGLTLSKVYLVINGQLRDNQLYVALSRARSIYDILISRKITLNDIPLAPGMKQFNNYIKENIIAVYNSE